VRRTPITSQRSPLARRMYRRPATIAAATMLALGAFTGIAAAVLTASTGAGQFRMDNRGETVGSTTASIVWVNLPGSDIPVNADSKLINARFTAESKCGGVNAGACVVRIIAVDAMGITVLDPDSGADFAFDSYVPGSTDGAEGHAMERSRRLNGGAYIIRVQYAVTNNTMAFTLDDWHFAVETSL
jgi:hypothetical protein